MFGTTGYAPAHFFAGGGSLGDLQRILNIGGATFYKDYQSPGIQADYSVGDGTATFTRTSDAAHPATYIDSNGVIQLVTTSDVPRFAGGYYDATGFHSQKGLMVEAAGTNFFLDSEFSRSIATDAWGSSFGTLTDQVCSINGISGAKSRLISYTYTGSESNYTSLLSQSFANDTFDASGGNIAVTFSFWARGDFSDITSTSDIKFILINELANDNTYQRTCLDRQESQAAGDGLHPTEWRRLSYSFNVTDTDTRKLEFRIGNTTTGTKPNAGDTVTIEVTGIQLEKSPYATSFTPTTTAALTRNPEILKYAIAGNRTAAQESIAIKFMPLGGSFANDGVYRFVTTSETKERSIRKLNTGTVPTYRPNATDDTNCSPSPTTTPLLNTSYVITGVAYGETVGTNAEVYTNGVSEAIDTDNYTIPAWGTNFFMGCDINSVNQLNGLIQKVAIFNRALTATEVASVTDLLEG